MLPHLFSVTSRRPLGTKTNGSRNHNFCKFLLNSSSKKQEEDDDDGDESAVKDDTFFIFNSKSAVASSFAVSYLPTEEEEEERGGYSRSSSSTDCTYSSTSASSSNVFLCLVISCSCAPCALCEVIVLMYFSDFVIRHSLRSEGMQNLFDTGEHAN